MRDHIFLILMTSMRSVQFSHANGFPAPTYTYLFEQMEGSQVSYIDRLGHGDFPVNGNLGNLARELINTLDKQQAGPVVGIGHSSGAVATMLAAAERPDLFTEVILIEPAFFSAWKRSMIRLVTHLGFADKLGPTPKALKRRDHFPDKETAREYFLQRRLFQVFHPQCFEDYLTHGLKPSDQGGLELAFSKKTEIEIFRSTHTRAPKTLRQLKGKMIYGETSDLFWRSDVAWWKRALPQFELVPFPGGHLFPLEQPDETADLINSILDH